MRPKKYLGLTGMAWMAIGILVAIGAAAWYFWTP